MRSLCGFRLGIIESRGYEKLVLEMLEIWVEVIAFYKKYGYRQTDRRDGDAHFELVI